MATANFYNNGNGGINAIMDGDEVVENYILIKDELYSKGFMLYNYQDDSISIHKDDKLVAVMSLEYGYYEGANVSLWLVADMTEEEMVYEFEDLVCNYSYDEDGWYMARKKFTRNQKEKNKVLKTVERYTEKLNAVASLSNGEAIYERAGK